MDNPIDDHHCKIETLKKRILACGRVEEQCSKTVVGMEFGGALHLQGWMHKSSFSSVTSLGVDSTHLFERRLIDRWAEAIGGGLEYERQ